MDSELKNIIESVLLVSEQPVSVQKIISLFPADARPQRGQVLEAVEELQRGCEGRAMELRRVGDGYRLQTREKYAPWLRKLNEARPPRYSRALLETLSIIAYRQPVTRGDIEEIRGVNVSTDIMRVLQDRGWVRVVGKKEVPGYPALYGTTREFLAYFNLASLRDLPPLKEMRDITEIESELNLELPEAGAPAVDETETAAAAETLEAPPSPKPPSP